MVSSWAPPVAGGSPVVLGHLLRGFPSDAYSVFTDTLPSFAGLPADGWLPVRHRFFEDPRVFTGPEAAAAAGPSRAGADVAVGRVVERATTPFTAVAEVTTKRRDLQRAVRAVIQAEDVDLVFAPSGDPVFMAAAARAAQATRRPLYVHLFDLLAGNRYGAVKRFFARNVEAQVLHSAARVFVPNSAMADLYMHRLGVKTTVVPNGTAVPAFSAARPAAQDGATIAYTGAIYWAQRDAVRNLVAAVRKLPNVRLELRTTATTMSLIRAGVRRDDVGGSFIGRGAAVDAQRRADVVFLPLSFGRAGRDVIRTALPGKTAEYMVSGTPILVHAPPYAYISRYAREAGWGYVVDSPDPDRLAEAIRRLLSDFSLRTRLTEAAYREASANLDLSLIAARYAEYFG